MKENKIIRDFHQAALQDRIGRGFVYFNFEEDFVENNVRCIPMIVRFKLDACGIKLKLSEWSKMVIEERKKYLSLHVLLMKRFRNTATI